MNDEKLMRFMFDHNLHEKVIKHLQKKKYDLRTINLFCHEDAWIALGVQIANGNYHFSPLIEDYVDKLTGDKMSYKAAAKRNFEKVRKLYKFDRNTTDGVVAYALYVIYYDLFIPEVNEKSVAYKEGTSTAKIENNFKDEVMETGYGTGFKADVCKYFDKVNMETVEEILNHMNTGSCLDKLLWELYHDDRVLVNGNLVHKYKGLMQGCAFACLLANLALKDVDDAITQMNVVYYRYSDDIICLGPDWKKALRVLEKLLTPKGLEIHKNDPEKFVYIHKGDWFEFLGIKIKGKYSGPAKKTTKNIEHEVKMRTIGKSRQLHRECTEDEIARMIRSLQKFFVTGYAKDRRNFGMGVYLFGITSIERDIQAIDEYCKDCLRAAYTNKSEIYGLGSVDDRRNYTIPFQPGKNVAENRRKTQSDEDDLLERLGWVSLVKLYHDYNTNKYLFEDTIYRMANFK